MSGRAADAGRRMLSEVGLLSTLSLADWTSWKLASALSMEGSSLRCERMVVVRERPLLLLLLRSEGSESVEHAGLGAEYAFLEGRTVSADMAEHIQHARRAARRTRLLVLVVVIVVGRARVKWLSDVECRCLLSIWPQGRKEMSYHVSCQRVCSRYPVCCSCFDLSANAELLVSVALSFILTH
jgi:hypothetical protein